MEKLGLDKFSDKKLENLKSVKGGCRATNYCYEGEERGDTLTCDGVFIAH